MIATLSEVSFADERVLHPPGKPPPDQPKKGKEPEEED
jgi:hypothetical protein